MTLLLSHNTCAGTFYIGQCSEGRFCPIFDGERLGSYPQLWQAIEAVARGVVFSVPHPESGDPIGTSLLGISRHASEWDPVLP